MNRILIITMHGASRAGKDTARSIIANQLIAIGCPVHCWDFADPLRQATCQLLGVTPTRLQSTSFRKTPLTLLGGSTPVQLMRALGTEFIRESFNDNYFVDLLEDKLKGLQALEGLHIVLVSDCRFPNEVALLHHYAEDCKHLIIDRPQVPWSTHASDVMNQALDEEVTLLTMPESFDYATHCYRIPNDTTLSDYNDRVLEWYHYFILDLSDRLS